MPASLLSLPGELRDQILVPLVRAKGTIELQYPLWADKSVFVPPIAQVCRTLRSDFVQLFYRSNVFVWKLEAEAADYLNPATFPLSPSTASTSASSGKDYGPTGPLLSSLPWQYPYALPNIRHLRLTIYLPAQYDSLLWKDKFAAQLEGLVRGIEQGRKLRDLRVLFASWHVLRDLNDRQIEVLQILRKMQVGGLVQVRTRSLDERGKKVVRELELERGMRAGEAVEEMTEQSQGEGAGGKHLDWEWEGGRDL